MKSAIFSNILLFLFMQPIVPAYNSVCYSCIGSNSKTCELKEEVCPEDCSCMTISEEFAYNGTRYYSINKRCAMNLPCNKYMYAFADTEAYIKMYLKCCEGDRCNSDDYDMPVETKEKGIQCPSCHKYGTLDGCNATKLMVCLGEDDMCIKFRATVFRPDGLLYNVSAQGCSSRESCIYDFSEAAATFVTHVVENTCYRPTIPLSQDYQPQH
ncbi:phospholipase A2 inhibitor gamma subunit B-like [Mantella aurantiaca]